MSQTAWPILRVREGWVALISTHHKAACPERGRRPSRTGAPFIPRTEPVPSEVAGRDEWDRATNLQTAVILSRRLLLFCLSSPKGICVSIPGICLCSSFCSFAPESPHLLLLHRTTHG